MDRHHQKIFFILCFALFNSVLGVGIVIPLLPVYAHSMGANGFYISMIFGSFSLSRTVLLPYFGRLSDKKGRKPILTFGLLFFAIVSIGFLYSNNVISLIVVRFFQGIGSAMIMPVASAYAGDIIPKDQEGKYMGLFNMALFVSLSIGPLTGGFINQYFNIQATFICMAVLAFSAFLIAFLFLPPVSQEVNAKNRQKGTIDWLELLKNRSIMALLVFRFSYTVGIGAAWCFIPVYADDEYHISSALIGLLVTTLVFVSAVLNTPMGILADRFDKKKMMLIGGVINVFALIAMSQTFDFWSMFLISVVFGVGGGIALPALTAMAVIEGANVKAMGSVMSMLGMAQSMGLLFGSLVAGIAMDYLGIRISFTLIGFLVLIGTSISFQMIRKTKIQRRS